MDVVIIIAAIAAAWLLIKGRAATQSQSAPAPGSLLDEYGEPLATPQNWAAEWNPSQDPEIPIPIKSPRAY